MQRSPNGAKRNGLVLLSEGVDALAGTSDRRQRSVVTSEPSGVRRTTQRGLSSGTPRTTRQAWPRQ